jgi:NitT/TauT family transport system ATP-binding protein
LKNDEHQGVTIRVEDLVIEYRTDGEPPLRAVDGVSFQVAPGKRLALVGPSGCGKSSILKVMCGLLQPTEGRVFFGSMDPSEAGRRRVFGMVPQHDALLKWRTTAGNVALPLHLDGKDKKYVERRVGELLKLFGLSEFASFYPNKLSGGMRSRTSIARALAVEPEILLLDECFASLDVLTRERLYKELSPMWTLLGTSLVFITHSVAEAAYLADEVIVLSPLPSRVIGRLTIEADQPRPENFMTSPAFIQAATQTRSLLGL